jgi:plasmid stabilization system protein ParE
VVGHLLRDLRESPVAQVLGDAGGAEAVAADAHADACRFGPAADYVEDIALPHRVARQAPRPAGHEGHLVVSAPAALAAAALATEVSVVDLKFEVKGTHELVMRPNYVIVYRVLQDAVELLRVLHATQQWPAAKRR